MLSYNQNVSTFLLHCHCFEVIGVCTYTKKIKLHNKAIRLNMTAYIATCIICVVNNRLSNVKTELI